MHKQDCRLLMELSFNLKKIKLLLSFIFNSLYFKKFFYFLSFELSLEDCEICRHRNSFFLSYLLFISFAPCLSSFHFIF